MKSAARLLLLAGALALGVHLFRGGPRGGSVGRPLRIGEDGTVVIPLAE